MPTPDASQYTQFRRFASVADDTKGSVGRKHPFGISAYQPTPNSSSSILTFLPSANKEKKFPSTVSNLPPGPLWVREIGNGLNGVSVKSITTDPNDGTVIVCGVTDQVLFDGPIGDTYAFSIAFIARYTPSGTFIAGTTLGSGLTDVSANSIVTDVHGNMYVCGRTRENLNNTDIQYNSSKAFYAKLTSTFELVWVFELGSGQQYTSAEVIMVSPDGYLYVGGQTQDTDWNNPSPHSRYEFSIAVTGYFDITTGEILSGSSYGTGTEGNVYVTGITYIPLSAIGLGDPNIPLIAVCGYSEENLGLTGGVSNPNGNGKFGFLSLNSFDLSSGPMYGLGSGDNYTVFNSMILINVPHGTVLILGGITNEYLDGPNKDSVLSGGGYQGFLTSYYTNFPFDTILPIGDEQNYTSVTALSSNDAGLCVGGFTNENLNTNETYTGMVLTDFILNFSFINGLPSLIQIGTGKSLEILRGIACDVFGNFYAGGFTQEHLPSGPAIAGVNGYIAKIAEQPKPYNTPIFIKQDPSVKDGDGVVRLEYSAPISIDWGDGTIDIITTGSAGEFTHTYLNPGLVGITVDAGSGGEITLLNVKSTGVYFLDVSRCSTLLSLRCDGNFLTNLDVSGCPDLTFLQCNKNYLISLDVSGLTSLHDLIFFGGENAVSTIHFEGCGLTDSTTTTLGNAISQLNDNNSSPGRIYLDSNQQSLYFNGNAYNFFYADLPDWTFIILPGIPDTIVTADLAGIVFNTIGNPGHSYNHTFSFAPTNTLEVQLINVDPSIKNVIHLHFLGSDTELTIDDKFVITDPSFLFQIGADDTGGVITIYSDGVFPMNSASKVFFITTNAITSVTFRVF
jgi:hypothetical protein